MHFEWDPQKARVNVSKHGVSFELAATIFADPLHLSIPDAGSASEERWITIGLAADRRTLIVVHLYRAQRNAELIRIISARMATKHERRQYEKGV